MIKKGKIIGVNNIRYYRKFQWNCPKKLIKNIKREIKKKKINCDPFYFNIKFEIFIFIYACILYVVNIGEN